MFNKKVIFYASLANTLYLLSTLFTVSDSLFNAPPYDFTRRRVNVPKSPSDA